MLHLKTEDSPRDRDKAETYLRKSAKQNYLPAINALAQIGADVLRKIGMTVDLQALDWGTVVQRRTSKQAPDKGGWNIFFTYLQGVNEFDPAAHR